MFYYSYNENSSVISKSLQPNGGIITTDGVDVSDEPTSLVAHSIENFDLSLYDVILGFVSSSGEILKYTKKLKGAEIVVQRISSIEERQTTTELDVDFRLSMLELGFI